MKYVKKNLCVLCAVLCDLCGKPIRFLSDFQISFLLNIEFSQISTSADVLPLMSLRLQKSYMIFIFPEPDIFCIILVFGSARNC